MIKSCQICHIKIECSGNRRYCSEECRKEAKYLNGKNFRIKNREYINQQKRKRYKEHRKLILTQNSKWRENNKDYKALKDKEYAILNKDKIRKYQKEWRDNNIDIRKEYHSEYSRNNRGKFNALVAKRRALQKQATPPWLTQFDYDYIKHIYIQAKELEKIDGIKRHVDHIYPLQGENSCGLHVPWNLQILTAEENLSKGNRL